MNETVRDALLSGLFVFVVTYLLVVPGDPLRDVLGDQTGEFGVVLGMIFVCTACGAAFAALTGIEFQRLLAGGIAVYFLWSLYLEATAGPFDSPVHLVLGVFLLFGFALGAGLVQEARRRGLLA